jgi:hypothetical protein
MRRIFQSVAKQEVVALVIARQLPGCRVVAEAVDLDRHPALGNGDVEHDRRFADGHRPRRRMRPEAGACQPPPRPVLEHRVRGLGVELVDEPAERGGAGHGSCAP